MFGDELGTLEAEELIRSVIVRAGMSTQTGMNMDGYENGLARAVQI